MTGDNVLIERLTKEARGLGFPVPSPKGPGLIGQDPKAVNEAIRQVRSQQAPIPEFGTGVQRRSPVVPRTSPVTELGPRERGGDLVPLGGRGQQTREIPSAEFMPPLPKEAPRPGNLIGPEGQQLSIGTTRFPAGATAPKDMVSPRGRITREGTRVGGRVMPREGVPVANTAADEFAAKARAGMREASSSPIPGTRFGAKPMDPFLDEQLSVFARRNPDSEFAKAIGEFDRSRLALDPSAGDLQLRRGVNFDPSVSDLQLRRGVNFDPAAEDLYDADFRVVSRVGYPGPDVRIGYPGPDPSKGIDFRPGSRFSPAMAGPGVGAALLASLGLSGDTAKSPVKEGFAQDPVVPALSPLEKDLDSKSKDAGTGQPGAGDASRRSTNPPVPATNLTPPGTQGVLPTRAEQSLARESAASDPVARDVLRLTEPMSPEKYGSLAEYRKAVSDYAKQSDVKRELIEFARGPGSSPEMSESLAKWAETHPALAYALEQRTIALALKEREWAKRGIVLKEREWAERNNQQSAEVAASTSTGSSLGNNNRANALGNALSAGDVAVEGNQGSYDLKSATDMVMLPKVERKDTPALLRTYLDAVGAVG